MLDAINETNTEVSALLAGAAKTIQAVRYCWLVTTATNGFNARPMGRILPEKGEDELDHPLCHRRPLAQGA